MVIGGYFLVTGFVQDGDYEQDTNELIGKTNPVPYVGLHNFVDEYRHPYSRNDLSATIIAVLEYWQKGVAEVETIDSDFDLRNRSGLTTYQDVVDYVGHNYGGFSVNVTEMSIDEAAAYMAENQGPLVISLPVTLDQPTTTFYEPLVVLKEINIQGEYVVYDSYWLGPNVKISVDEYNALQNRMSEERQNRYVIVEPLERGALPDHVGFFTDFSLPEADRSLYADYAIALGAQNQGVHDVAVEYYTRVTENERFAEVFPPSLRVILLSQYAGLLANQLTDFETAEIVAQRAIDENVELNTDFSYFGDFGYLFESNAEGQEDRLSLPHIVMGDVYRKTGQTDLAIEQYEQALRIFPLHVGVREELDKLLGA